MVVKFVSSKIRSISKKGGATTKKRGKGKGKGRAHPLNPVRRASAPPLNPARRAPPLNPVRRASAPLLNPARRAPPLNPARIGIPSTDNVMFTSADEIKLHKFKNYKTHCDNLAILYKKKHNDEVIPLVDYIKKIRELTPEKRIGELNIPKFIASLKKIDVPDFNDSELQRKVDEQKDMMRKSTNKVSNIMKKIEDFGVTVPPDVLVPGPDIFGPNPSSDDCILVSNDARVDEPLPAFNPSGSPVLPGKGMKVKIAAAAKKLAAATKKIGFATKKNIGNNRGPVLPPMTAGNKKKLKKNTKKKK
jgi:hypothetical protein